MTESAHWSRFKRWVFGDFWYVMMLIQIGVFMERAHHAGIGSAIARATSFVIVWIIGAYIAAVATTLWIRAAIWTIQTVPPPNDGGADA